MSIDDQSERQTALNPEQSFIVQAPAGSGKTELLTQRLLVLLAHAVETPEEIIALTFTRKAAREMRDRVLEALRIATQQRPTETHKQHTWQLARAVLEKDQQAEWNLLSNPNRLNIMTIDSLTATINKKTPLLSQVGSQPQLVDNAMPYFERAAVHLLDTLSQQDHPISPALQTILLHCDNRATTVIQLFAQLLNKRQQWLSTIIHSDDDHQRLQHLEQTLEAINLDAIQRVLDLIDPSILHQILIHAQSAAEILIAEEPHHPMQQLITLQEPLSVSLTQRDAWRQLASCLLTQQGEWRKSLTKRQGFTAKSQHKLAMQALLDQCRPNEALRLALHDILHAPPIAYSDEQATILDALFTTLPHLAAHLTLVFQQHNVIDFSELTLAALRALGSSEQPTDLALYLDDRISHLLVDEFQDTSITQYQLLQRLTYDWYDGDGRTVFFVGDPMQSIYRFRNAEVTLFMQAQTRGFGQLSLIPLQLTMNFRSKHGVVHWVNQTFTDIFPQSVDLTYGGVPLSPAVSHDQSSENCIHYYNSLSSDTTPQGERIAQTIIALRQDQPNASIAILVRSRTHLHDILPYLSRYSIPVHATDIDPLNTQPEIIDALTVCRALLSQNDRIAWLALLRSPMCGLSLDDCFILSQTAPHQTVWQRCLDDRIINTLSTHAQAVILRIRPSLILSHNQMGRVPFSYRFKFTWLALGGAQCLTSKQAYAHCETLFDVIVKIEQQRGSVEWSAIEEQIARLFAEPQTHSEQAINIMTIHKSKGLEFDHVLLPHLESGSANSNVELLKWQEYIDLQQRPGLAMAPIKASHSTEDSIYTSLSRFDTRKTNYEKQRLLYVAVTRAKSSLHLFASSDSDDQESIKPPRSNSMLQLLWKTHQIAFEKALLSNHIPSMNEAPVQASSASEIQYLAEDWQAFNGHPQHYASTSISLAAVRNKREQPAQVKLDREKTQRLIGTVVHSELEYISIHKQTINGNDIQTRARRLLRQHGIDDSLASKASERICKCLQELQNDPRAQWLLWETHPTEHSEYAITTTRDLVTRSMVIDRLIIDRNDQLWIIDYKTSQPEQDEPLSDFLNNKQKEYQKQIEQYVEAIQQCFTNPIRCALYFPFTQAWHSWQPAILETT